MKPDLTERELLRWAERLDAGQEVDWKPSPATDPALRTAMEGMREIEALSLAFARDPAPRGESERPGARENPGAMLGRYPVEREAGRGGMGVVYLARDTVLDRPVALKLLPSVMARAPERLARFTREAKLLASLNHPNVATIHGLEEDTRGLRFLVLEWVAGESLSARLQRGALPWREALDVCRQIAEALAAAHESGVIHRDLKPGNVMITPQGRVKVLDFGLARREIVADEAVGPSEPAIRGTWGYVSPECLTRDDDHRADLFAFGCVLYECLAGVPAFPGESVDEVRDAVLHREPDESRLPPETPPRVRRLIASCVAKDPSRRLGSIAEARRTIDSAIGHRPSAPEVTASRPHRLPRETNAFVGRESELAELSERFRRGVRVATLLGTGGMGKTRLAARFGWRSLEEWAGGVWFCDLTEAKGLDGILGAVATGLGIPLGAADPVAQIGQALLGRGPCLVILDNFEQVAKCAATTITPWMESAPDARFLVTSRKRLDLAQEEVQAVESLNDEWGRELFLDRARTHRAEYEAGGPELQAVRQILSWVEGMPLAIELAAARVRTMSAAQIVERMRERFRLLAGSTGGRHATLKAVLDGSWELLTPWEQAAFAQCAVFDGGFTLTAAEAVLDLSAWEDAPWVPDVMQSLLDQSLLRTWSLEETSGEVRFAMLVSMQEYARGKLDTHAARAAEIRHGQWFANYGSDEEMATLAKPGGVEIRRKRARELDNLIVASRRASARRDSLTAAACYRAAFDVVQLKGPARLAVDLGRELLAESLDEKSRTTILGTLGFAEWRGGLIEDAQLHFEETLALHRAAGNRRGEGVVLGYLGGLNGDRGRVEEGRACQEMALAIAEELGDRRWAALELGRLSILNEDQGRLLEARSQLESALVMVRESGDLSLESQVLGHLGPLLRDLGEFVQGRAHIESAIRMFQEVGNRRHEGVAEYNLGILYAGQGQSAEAFSHFATAMAITLEVGNRTFEGHVSFSLGRLYLDLGRIEEARESFEKAAAIYRETREQRFEGIAFGEWGRLYLEKEKLNEAGDMLARGEALLRKIGCRVDLGILQCIRAEWEGRSGAPEKARATLADVEALATELGLGPQSELGRQLGKARQALAPPT